MGGSVEVLDLGLTEHNEGVGSRALEDIRGVDHEQNLEDAGQRLADGACHVRSLTCGLLHG